MAIQTEGRMFRSLRLFVAISGLLPLTSHNAAAQEPAAWRDSLVFHTFSIAAVDPRTGEVGVAVTTRVPCVGNGVPWVRAGVGAGGDPGQHAHAIRRGAARRTGQRRIAPGRTRAAAGRGFGSSFAPDRRDRCEGARGPTYGQPARRLGRPPVRPELRHPREHSGGTRSDRSGGQVVRSD